MTSSSQSLLDLYRPITPELDELDLIASRFDGYDEQPRYTREEWRDAAQYLIDSEDDSELRFMARQQGLFDGFCRLPEREQDEWVGFGNYAAVMGGAL